MREVRLFASVILDLRGPETSKPMPFDGALPGHEFVDRQLIAFAGVIEAKKAAPHCSDDLRFSADNPAFGVWRGEVRNGQRTAVGSNHITQAGTERFGHVLSHAVRTMRHL